MTPAGARLILDAARSTAAHMEDLHLVATRAEGAALLVLSSACTAYEDDPSDTAAAAWREAREARELAALRSNGALRRLDAARAAVTAAEQGDAAACLADALVRADRARLFADLADVVLDVAAIDHVPPVDFAAPIADDLAAVRLGEQAERAAIRALRCRVIRRAVEAQNAAVADARAAARELGQALPRSVAEVPEQHVFAAVALELLALGPMPSDIGARDRFVTSWIADNFVRGNVIIAHNEVSHARDTVAGTYMHTAQTWPLWLAYLRGVVLTGDTTARRMVPVEDSAPMAPPASAPPPAAAHTREGEQVIPPAVLGFVGRTPSFSM